ncbi:MAG: rhodanese-like domain-containing protein [Campylobacterota bacterium]|nr:rhodanese-like domain-containing protein [Campylobacterota bacterium]
MRRVLFGLMVMGSLLFAEVQHITASEDFLKKGITVVDIRTPGEWRETGIVKGSHTIMFFDERGGYDVDNFLIELNRVVKKDEPFALICRTGSRTAMISDFLDKDLGYRVINLQGGIMNLMRSGYKTTAYR